jgi:hypothetical protein
MPVSVRLRTDARRARPHAAGSAIQPQGATGKERENAMLDYMVMKPEGIVVMTPKAPLSKEDFSGLSAAVDAYLSDHASIRGVLIHAESFPGWESFAGFVAHMRFVRDHHKKVGRVALVTDSALADMAKAVAGHFAAAEFRHFPYAEKDKALDWLKGA